MDLTYFLKICNKFSIKQFKMGKNEYEYVLGTNNIVSEDAMLHADL